MSIDANRGQEAGDRPSGTLRARIRSPRDVLAGLLFVAIGVATVIGASDYPLGTIRNIGPGYYPILLGIALVLLGAGITFKGVTISAEPSDDEESGFAIRPLVMVIAAVAAFGLLARPFGLGVAIVALVVISSLAGREFSIIRVIVICVAMVALSWLVFIYVLGLSMSMWPR